MDNTTYTDYIFTDIKEAFIKSEDPEIKGRVEEFARRKLGNEVIEDREFRELWLLHLDNYIKSLDSSPSGDDWLLQEARRIVEACIREVKI